MQKELRLQEPLQREQGLVVPRAELQQEEVATSELQVQGLEVEAEEPRP